MRHARFHFTSRHGAIACLGNRIEDEDAVYALIKCAETFGQVRIPHFRPGEFSLAYDELIVKHTYTDEWIIEIGPEW